MKNVLLFIVLIAATVLVGCSVFEDDAPVTLTLMSHESFTVSEEILANFTDETGIMIELLPAGDAGEALNQAIRDYQTIYTQSWKVEEPFAEFMPGLIRLAAKQGWLRLGVAYYDDTPVAAQLWIVAHGRASIFKLAYDEAYKKLSAGTILTDFLMKHVIDVDKVSEIDYLIGDDGYKKEWMSHRKERWGLVAFNPCKLDGLVGVINEGARKCIKYMFSRRRKQRAQ